MTTTLPVLATGGALSLDLTADLKSAHGYALAEKADATRDAYRSDFRDFSTYASAHGLTALPAQVETVAAYLAQLADRGRKASTIMRRCAAIAYAHRLAGFEPPTQAEPVKAVLRGIRRRTGVAVERKAPATARAISKMLSKIPDTRLGRRDRALLLIGFAAALRRSELVALTVADIERAPEGIFIHIRRSKTDKSGAGHMVAVPRGSKLKPVEALEEWLATAGISEGRIFDLTPQSVALVVKRRALAAKLNPAIFSGHSLRAGFVTSALENGADVLKVMSVTRHQRVDTLHAYDRRAKAFQDHAAKGFL